MSAPLSEAKRTARGAAKRGAANPKMFGKVVTVVAALMLFNIAPAFAEQEQGIPQDVCVRKAREAAARLGTLAAILRTEASHLAAHRTLHPNAIQAFAAWYEVERAKANGALPNLINARRTFAEESSVQAAFERFVEHRIAEAIAKGRAMRTEADAGCTQWKVKRDVRSAVGSRLSAAPDLRLTRWHGDLAASGGSS